MRPRCGQLLIAASTLADPNFHRTVVLIVKDDENGTFGLVLNRPLETSVKDACTSIMEADCPVDSPLHLGGPCEGLLTVIHSQPDLAEVEVAPGVFFTAEKAKIERLMAENQQPAKFFAGYSGWSAGQLDAELKNGAWLLTPADQRQIFTTGEDQWNRVITQLTVGRWIDVERMPQDPSVN